MTTPNRIAPPSASDAYEPRSPVEKLEEDASSAGLAAGDALRGVDVAAAVLLGLLVCPPLAILTVVVVVPLLVTALVLGLLAAVVSTPYLLVHHLRGNHGGHASLLGHHLRSNHGGHASLLGHRLRRAGRALADLLPHRIVADARKLHPGR
jgi:hypothetical protein